LSGENQQIAPVNYIKIERYNASVRITPLTLCLPLLALTGCIKLKPSGPPPTPGPTPAPKPPVFDTAKVKPDELGKIPVIMYHDIGRSGKNTPLDRTVASFEKDLELLYEKGFYLVNAADVANNNLDVPVGKSPVVLTFDDARKTQFNLLPGDTGPRVDPNCALGVLERFIKTHPDWKLRATFFVLPKSRATNESFGQTGMGKDKVAYLIKQGCEVANHSIVHKSFADYTAAQIQAEVGGADRLVTELNPEVKIETIALPMGKFPRNKALWPLLIKGTDGGHAYAYKAAFDAAWRPIPSPSSKKYNPLRLERINSVEGLNGIRYWVEKLIGPGGDCYVSDGDPNWVSFPKAKEAELARERVQSQGKRINAYAGAGIQGAGIQSAASSTPATR
jgi:peptidoglycan/xylan/chitin deacetylase (PgdA/CDA1 family)